jgi:hypothetical protein
MTRVENKDETPKDLDNSNAPSPDYTVEDFTKMIL